MSQSQPTDPTPTYNRADYVGLLVRLDIPGTLDYLDRCGETAMADALRRISSATRSPSPPAIRCWTQSSTPINITFKPASPPRIYPSKRRNETARETLTAQLGEILAQPGADLDALEEAAKAAFEAAGWHFLGGMTQGYRGPYIWRTTTRTDYDVEIPSGIETVTVFWMDGFLMRSWLDWLSDGEVGAGGWAKDEGLYCVRKVYADKLDQPQLPDLLPQARSAAPRRLSPGRAGIVAAGISRQAGGADLHARFILPAVAAGLRRPGEQGQQPRLRGRQDPRGSERVAGSAGRGRWPMRVLEAAAADVGNWADMEGVIRKGARELLE